MRENSATIGNLHVWHTYKFPCCKKNTNGLLAIQSCGGPLCKNGTLVQLHTSIAWVELGLKTWFHSENEIEHIDFLNETIADFIMTEGNLDDTIQYDEEDIQRTVFDALLNWEPWFLTKLMKNVP